MVVGYTHDSKTLWRLWDPKFQRVKTQLEVVFDKEWNAHTSCQHGSNVINKFGFPEDEDYDEETDTTDESLRDSQPTQIGQPMQRGKRSKSHMHEAPDKEAENAHCRRLRREDQTAQRLAAAIKKSSQVPQAAPAPTIGSRVTRSQSTASAEALMACTEDPYTYAKAMESPQHNHWKRAMEEEITSILLNNTFSTLNSQEARQLQVKLISSKWVYKTKHNPDRSTRYEARLVIKGY